MSEDLTIRISKHPSGAKLSYRLGSQDEVVYFSRQKPDFIIDLLNKGFTQRGLPPVIDGVTLSNFKLDGLNRV